MTSYTETVSNPGGNFRFLYCLASCVVFSLDILYSGQTVGIYIFDDRP